MIEPLQGAIPFLLVDVLNPVLLALDARVTLRSKRGPRDVAAREFLTGYRTNLRADDELIESVTIPSRPTNERRGFRKVGTRRAQSISKVVVAVAFEFDGRTFGSVRAAVGCVAPITVLLPTLTRELDGAVRSPETLADAIRTAVANDCSPIDDVRSTAAYRREVLARVLRSLLSG